MPVLMDAVMSDGDHHPMCCDAVGYIMQALCVIHTNQGWSPTGPARVTVLL